jgi:uncharacterized protein YjbI with pentapeptide repeats
MDQVIQKEIQAIRGVLETYKEEPEYYPYISERLEYELELACKFMDTNDLWLSVTAALDNIANARDMATAAKHHMRIIKTTPAPTTQRPQHLRLAFADLSCADLRGADLTGADLSGADLTGAVLTGADMSGATLIEACLINVDLTGATLIEACLINADMTGALFRDCFEL